MQSAVQQHSYSECIDHITQSQALLIWNYSFYDLPWILPACLHFENFSWTSLLIDISWYLLVLLVHIFLKKYLFTCKHKLINFLIIIIIVLIFMYITTVYLSQIICHNIHKIIVIYKFLVYKSILLIYMLFIQRQIFL